MCIAAVYFQEFDSYPLVIAANRDEHFDRPSAPPGVLARGPLIIGGKDLLAGGTWLGINEHGLAAGALNRRSEAESMPSHYRSRGLLCLDFLRLKEPAEVCALLKTLRGSDYRPFNLFFANAQEAYVAYNQGEEIVRVRLSKGLHVLGNTAIYHAGSEKLNRAYALFNSMAESAGLKQDYSVRSANSAWIGALRSALSDHSPAVHSSDSKDAICVHTPSYGTVSSSIIFYNRGEKSFYHYHAPGAPCRTPYEGPLSLKLL